MMYAFMKENTTRKLRTLQAQLVLVCTDCMLDFTSAQNLQLKVPLTFAGQATALCCSLGSTLLAQRRSCSR